MCEARRACGAIGAFLALTLSLWVGCAVIQSDGMSVTNAGTSNLEGTWKLWKLNA